MKLYVISMKYPYVFIKRLFSLIIQHEHVQRQTKRLDLKYLSVVSYQ